MSDATPARRGRGRPPKHAAAVDGQATAPAKAEKSELEQVKAEIQKRFGAAVISRGSDVRQPWRIPLGIFSFDLATCGGIPHNRVSMFHGPKHSGKTTAAEKAIAGMQRSLPGLQAAFLDIEGTRDTTWAGKLGVDNDALVYAQPERGEDAVDIAEALLRTREIGLVVVDSVAALAPGKEIDDSATDPTQPGMQARLMAKFMRKAQAALIAERQRNHFVSLLVINQQRAKIGGWAPPGQEAIQTAGGKALGFANTLEVRFKNKENVTKDANGFDTLDFNEHSFKIEKNKCNAGLRDGDYQLMRRDSDKFPLLEGDIDDAPSMLAHAKKIGCYSGGGKSWKLEIPDFSYTFGNAEEAILYLYENRDVYWQLRCHLIADHAARLGLPQYFINYLYGDAVE